MPKVKRSARRERHRERLGLEVGKFLKGSYPFRIIEIIALEGEAVIGRIVKYPNAVKRVGTKATIFLREIDSEEWEVLQDYGEEEEKNGSVLPDGSARVGEACEFRVSRRDASDRARSESSRGGAPPGHGRRRVLIRKGMAI